VAISPDGRTAASASDGPIVCHSIGPFGLPPRIFGSVGVGCGPDFGIVRVFDVATGQQKASLKHAGTAHSVAFSPDGKLLASGGGGTAKLWDLATNKARTVIKTEDGLDVYCVAFSPDGLTLAVGVGSRDFDGSYGEVRLWDVGLGGVRAVLKGEAGKIRSLAFAPDGKSLVTGSRRAVAIWGVPPATNRGVRRRTSTAKQ
jgi:WD40 repeat protein